MTTNRKPFTASRIRVLNSWGTLCTVYPFNRADGHQFSIMVDTALQDQPAPDTLPALTNKLLAAMVGEQASALHGHITERPDVLFVITPTFLLLTHDEALRIKAWDTETGADLEYVN